MARLQSRRTSVQVPSPVGQSVGLRQGKIPSTASLNPPTPPKSLVGRHTEKSLFLPLITTPPCKLLLCFKHHTNPSETCHASQKNNTRACAYLESLKGTLPVSTVDGGRRHEVITLYPKTQWWLIATPQCPSISPVPLVTVAGSNGGRELSEHHPIFIVEDQEQRAGSIKKTCDPLLCAINRRQRERATTEERSHVQSLSRRTRPTPCVQAHKQQEISAWRATKMGCSRKCTGQHIGEGNLGNASLGEAREALRRTVKFQIRDGNKCFSSVQAALFVSTPFATEASPPTATRGKKKRNSPDAYIKHDALHNTYQL